MGESLGVDEVGAVSRLLMNALMESGELLNDPAYSVPSIGFALADRSNLEVSAVPWMTGFGSSAYSRVVVPRVTELSRNAGVPLSVGFRAAAFERAGEWYAARYASPTLFGKGFALYASATSFGMTLAREGRHAGPDEGLASWMDDLDRWFVHSTSLVAPYAQGGGLGPRGRIAGRVGAVSAFLVRQGVDQGHDYVMGLVRGEIERPSFEDMRLDNAGV